MIYKVCFDCTLLHFVFKVLPAFFKFAIYSTQDFMGICIHFHKICFEKVQMEMHLHEDAETALEHLRQQAPAGTQQYILCPLNDGLQCLRSTKTDTQAMGFQTCYTLNMWVNSVAVRLTGRQKALNGQSSWKLMFVLILFSSWLLQTGGSFNLDVPSITCDSVEIAAVWVYWLRRKSEGNTTPSSQ